MTNTTDTPRTNKEAFAHFEGFCVSIAFARGLERELTEAQAIIHKMTTDTPRTDALDVKTETSTRLDTQNPLNMHDNTDTPRTDADLLERLIQLEEQLYSRDRAKEIADWYASREMPRDPMTSEEAKFADCTVFSQEVKRLEAEVERLTGIVHEVYGQIGHPYIPSELLAAIKATIN